jgi:hypothetical protein
MCPVSAMVMITIRISREFAKIAPKRGRKSPKYYQTTLEYSTSKNNREYHWIYEALDYEFLLLEGEC